MTDFRELGIFLASPLVSPKLPILNKVKVTPSNDRVLCIYAPSGHNTREQLTKEHFLEGLQNYMENKRKGNENEQILGELNKIIPAEFACTMNKIDRDGGNKTQRIYKCGSNYALSKLIVDNGL